MSDILRSTVDTAGFVPQYWANRALDVLRSRLVLANLVAKDVNFAEPGWCGKSVTVPYPGTFSAVDKVADAVAVPQVPSGGSSVTLTLSQHKIVPFLIEDFANAQANMGLMDRYVEPAVIALAEQFEKDLWGQYPNLTSIIGTAGTDLTAANVRSAFKTLNDNKAPTSDRFLVVSTKDQIALLADSGLANFFAFARPEGVSEAYMGRLYGLDTYMSQLVPTGYQVNVGNSTGGTFTLTYGGQTTSAIAYDAAASAVQTALVALSTIDTADVVVSGTTPTFQVNFQGALADTTSALTGSGSSLTGGTHILTITTATKCTAFHRNAIMYAVRPFPETAANAGVMTAQANDPESGLSIRISTQYDINNVGMRCNLDMLYGMCTLRASQACVVNT